MYLCINKFNGKFKTKINDKYQKLQILNLNRINSTNNTDFSLNHSKIVHYKANIGNL